MALKKLGIEKAPVITLDHLSDEQRRAYTHVHNKTNMNTGFDLSILAVDINELDFEWDDFGFDAFDLADIATSQDNFQPRTEEINEYAEQGESQLKSYNVVICCLDEGEQEWLSEFLNVDGRLKRLYMCSELMENNEQ